MDNPTSTPEIDSNLSSKAVKELFLVVLGFVIALFLTRETGDSGGRPFMFFMVRLVSYVVWFFVFFIPGFVVALLVSRIVPNYRRIPYVELVRKTTRVVAMFCVLFIFGLWYAHRG